MTQTLAELQAQRAAIELEIDKLLIDPLTAMVNALADPAIANAFTILSDRLPELTGDNYQQVQNIITVLSHSPQVLLSRRDEIVARVHAAENPPIPPEGA